MVLCSVSKSGPTDSATQHGINTNWMTRIHITSQVATSNTGFITHSVFQVDKIISRVTNYSSYTELVHEQCQIAHF